MKNLPLQRDESGENGPVERDVCWACGGSGGGPSGPGQPDAPRCPFCIEAKGES